MFSLPFVNHSIDLPQKYYNKVFKCLIKILNHVEYFVIGKVLKKFKIQWVIDQTTSI